MKEKLNDIDLYFITDSKLTRRTVLEDVRSAVKAGVKVIQYREKDLCTREMINEAEKMCTLCKENDALFIVNDRVDIALAVNADGVHLGNEDMDLATARKILGDTKIIGLTVHDVGEAIEAERIGADYIGISPIFETKTKPDAGLPAGINLIKHIKNIVKIPFVAIGGINEYNIKSVMEAGARSIAIISAIVATDDVEDACRRFREVIKRDSIK